MYEFSPHQCSNTRPYGYTPQQNTLGTIGTHRDIKNANDFFELNRADIYEAITEVKIRQRKVDGDEHDLEEGFDAGWLLVGVGWDGIVGLGGEEVHIVGL